MKKTFTATVAALALAVSVAAPARRRRAEAPKDIVDTAVAAGSFNTLATALKAAGLVDTLKGKGPFTVFAPTDDAFKKLPAGTLEKLLADKAQLTKVLTYHVVAGKVMAADVVKLNEAKTVEGSMVKITVAKRRGQGERRERREDRHRRLQRRHPRHRLGHPPAREVNGSRLGRVTCEGRPPASPFPFPVLLAAHAPPRDSRPLRNRRPRPPPRPRPLRPRAAEPARETRGGGCRAWPPR